jgi:16S rRNA G966 N2-methylase RsmD|tara:strand:+ start:664 stop:1335 length:672 start_codon:yes stop_codon:yes gene_type:complete
MLTVVGTKINYKEIYDLVKNLPTGKNVLTKPRGDFFYDPHILDEQYKGTEIEKVLDLIPMHGEARVIVMEPGQSYSAHADVDDRWHLTLDADESYLVDLKNQKMYKLVADGTLYLMDSGRLHTASNYGYKPRYQLVIRKRLKGRILDNPVYFNLTLIDPPYNARYLFDKSFSILLNRLEKEEKITNFKKISDKEIEFVIESEQITRIKELQRSCGFKFEIRNA